MRKHFTIGIVLLLLIFMCTALVACDGFSIDVSKILHDYVNYEQLYVRVEYLDGSKREFSKFKDTIYMSEVENNIVINTQYYIKEDSEYSALIQLDKGFYKFDETAKNYDALSAYIKSMQDLLLNVSNDYCSYTLTGNELKGKDKNGIDISIYFGQDYLKLAQQNVTYVYKQASFRELPKINESEIDLGMYIDRVLGAKCLTVEEGLVTYNIDGDIIQKHINIDGHIDSVVYHTQNDLYYKITKDDSILENIDKNQESQTPEQVPVEYKYTQVLIEQQEYLSIKQEVDEYIAILQGMPKSAANYEVIDNQYILETMNGVVTLTLYANYLSVSDSEFTIIYGVGSRIILPIAQVI